MQAVRQPAVAGTFYAVQHPALTAQVQSLLAEVRPAPATRPPKALVVPHAGYIYSGSTAACAYALLAPLRPLIRRVVLLGPAHRVPLRGLALPPASAFATPLGEVPLDLPAMATLAALPQVSVSAAAHALEHALEVQLPFLQAVLGRFSLVPLVVGAASPAEVAQVLEALWGGAETLIVVSTDLSHYLPYRNAQALDQATVQTILALDSTLTPQQACGASPLNGLLLAARQHHLQATLLGLCNSGDTAGDRQRVVGYAALSLTPGVSDGP